MNSLGSSDFPLGCPSGKSDDPRGLGNSLGPIFPDNHYRISTVYTSRLQLKSWSGYYWKKLSVNRLILYALVKVIGEVRLKAITIRTRADQMSEKIL